MTICFLSLTLFIKQGFLIYNIKIQNWDKINNMKEGIINLTRISDNKKHKKRIYMVFKYGYGYGKIKCI